MLPLTYCSGIKYCIFRDLASHANRIDWRICASKDVPTTRLLHLLSQLSCAWWRTQTVHFKLQTLALHSHLPNKEVWKGSESWWIFWYLVDCKPSRSTGLVHWESVPSPAPSAWDRTTRDLSACGRDYWAPSDCVERVEFLVTLSWRNDMKRPHTTDLPYQRPGRVLNFSILNATSRWKHIRTA